MVNSLSLLSLTLSLVLSIAVPLGTAIYFRRRDKISYFNIFAGAGVFLLFALVLEQGMHVYMLKANLSTAVFINSNPWIFALYGAFAAGIFEETGRLAAFKLLLKGRTQRKDGIAYGIGHGGMEAILIGGFSMAQNLYFALLINSGKLASTMGTRLSDSMLDQISSALINTNPFLFLISGFERTIAFVIQVGLSLMVLHAVRSKKYHYFALAILLHAAVDFPAGLYQKGIISNVWSIEAVCLIFAAASLIFINKWDRIFKYSK